MPPADTVTVQFTLSRAEYLAGSRAAMRRQWALVAVPVCGLAGVLLGLVQGIAAVAPGVLLLLMSGWLWWIAPRRRWAGDPAQAGPFTYGFDDAGIAINSRAADVRLPWDRVRAVIRSKELLLLRIGRIAVVVPYRAMSEADRAGIDELLQRHLG